MSKPALTIHHADNVGESIVTTIFALQGRLCFKTRYAHEQVQMFPGISITKYGQKLVESPKICQEIW